MFDLKHSQPITPTILIKQYYHIVFRLSLNMGRKSSTQSVFFYTYLPIAKCKKSMEILLDSIKQIYRRM